MTSDNGELETQEDALDHRMKSHRRAEPPTELLDMCIATVARQVLDARPESASNTAAPVRSPRWRSVPWVKLAAAACLLLGVGFFFWPEVQHAREAAERTSSRNNLKQVGLAMNNLMDAAKEQVAPASTADNYATSNGAVLKFADGTVTYYAESSPAWAADSKIRVRDVQDGTAMTATLGEPAGGERVIVSVPAERSSDALDVVVQDTTRRESTSVSRESAEPAAAPATTPAAKESKEDQRRLGRATLFSGRGLPENLQQLESKEGALGAKAKARGGALEQEVERARSTEPRLSLNYLEDGVVRFRGLNQEIYLPVADNAFLPVSKSPLSTFSIDVDTASYSNVRRFLNQGTLPPRDAVRIEELVNYFKYDYEQAKSCDPFCVNLEVAGCPWNGEHRLVRVGLKGREVANDRRPPANLVFLVDVSGSMQPANKLPLLKTALKMLTQRLGENERVAIVTYSHEIKLVLPSTTCDHKDSILAALDGLQANGSTNGGGGIQLAYQTAVANFIPGGINRVILATDGDFNVGITDRDELTRFIELKAQSGVFLSVLGFGFGNLKDATLERLADKGNGHYAYIDTIDEARKVLVDQLTGTLMTIAKDVKLQIEFNPATVSAFRLIGYENRILAHKDFNDDRKDAGDVGAGHTVTALYEIVPAGKPVNLPGQPNIDPLKYQKPSPPPATEERRIAEDRPAAEKRPGADDAASGELLTVKLRYKQPDEHTSKLIETPLTDSGRRFGEASSDFKFAASVAAFGMILRDSPYRGTASFDAVLELAEDGRGTDREGYRAEFIKLVRLAKSIAGR